jgi:four helix bundle protein
MVKVLNFEELLVWQKVKGLFVELFIQFENCKNFFFTNQLLRASLSVSNNIVEGFDSGSDKELVRFFYTARGSNSEVKSMIYLA